MAERFLTRTAESAADDSGDGLPHYYLVSTQRTSKIPPQGRKQKQRFDVR
jgi:hypothetical protein